MRAIGAPAWRFRRAWFALVTDLAARAQVQLETRLADIVGTRRAQRVNDVVYRLVVGPYTSVDDAELARKAAVAAGVADAWLTRNPGDNAGLALGAVVSAGDAFADGGGDVPVDPLMMDLPDLEQANLPEFDPRGPLPSEDDTDYTFNADAETGFNRLYRGELRYFVDPHEDGEAAGGMPEPGSDTGPINLSNGARRPLEIPHIAHADADIRVDGRLDEAAWQSVPAYSGFVVIDPATLAIPEYETRLKFLYTERGLYFAAQAEQPPETLLARLSSRDARNINRDSISITLDTSGEGRYGYWFSVNLGGSLSDGTVLPERRFSNRWDGPWQGASAETDSGWVAEFFLPWSMMAMPAADGARTMGLYVSRKVAHVDQRWALPALPGTQPQFMSALQPIRLASVQPRRQLTFYPFAASSLDRTRNDAELTAGADVFWRPSSNLQLAATVNPDFGNVESDDVVVNLTAFETFFPEKRAFFLEGQEIFITSPRADVDRRTPTTLLNTRRIGSRLPTPELPRGADFSSVELAKPTELYGAAKVTGQLGALRYGVLGALEEDTFYEGTRQLADGRVVASDIQQSGRRFGAMRGLWESSTAAGYRALGVMSTRVTHPTGDAVVHGADWHYLSPAGTLKADGQLMVSDVHAAGVGFGTFADLEYTPRGGHRHRLQLDRTAQRPPPNDAGFLRRNDVLGLRYDYRRTKTGLERFRQRVTTLAAQQQVNHRGHLTSARFSVERSWQLHNLARIRADWTYVPPRWEDRNSEGNGEYRIEERNFLGLRYESDRSKPVSYALRGAWREEDLGGQHFQSVGQVSIRPVDRFAMNVQVSHRERNGWLLHQQGRNFTTFEAEEWRPRLDMDFFLSARQQLRVSFQWTAIKAFEDQLYAVPTEEGTLVRREHAPGEEADDFAVSRMTLQLRYRWEIAPLSDLFLVYTRNGDDANVLGESFEDGFVRTFNDPVAEQLILKLRYRVGA